MVLEIRMKKGEGGKNAYVSIDGGVCTYLYIYFPLLKDLQFAQFKNCFKLRSIYISIDKNHQPVTMNI